MYATDLPFCRRTVPSPVLLASHWISYWFVPAVVDKGGWLTTQILQFLKTASVMWLPEELCISPQQRSLRGSSVLLRSQINLDKYPIKQNNLFAPSFFPGASISAMAITFPGSGFRPSAVMR